MARNAYPSDLTDEQWNLIAPLIPRPKSGKRGGRPQTTDMRAVVSGVLYLSRSGCSWRMLPRDFPPWPTVHHYYRQWRRNGTWKKLHDGMALPFVCIEVRSVFASRRMDVLWNRGRERARADLISS